MLCHDNNLICLIDFETTGFAHDDWAEVIEVGFLIINNRLDVLADYETLVYPHSRDASNNWEWEPRELPAFEKSHRIEPKELYDCRKYHEDVLKDFNDIIRDLQPKPHRIELMSDNPYFDFHFAKKIGLPIHYNPLDAKPLLRMAGIKRPDRFQKQHRAMNDVLNLYRALVVAYERLGGHCG